MAANDGWFFFFLSSFLNLPWLVGMRHRIPARAREGICSSSVLQAQNQILFMEFNPLCWLAALDRLARKWWGERYWRKRQVERGEDRARHPCVLGAQGVCSAFVLVLFAASWGGKNTDGGVDGLWEPRCTMCWLVVRPHGGVKRPRCTEVG